jgi:hypothetical protein
MTATGSLDRKALAFAEALEDTVPILIVFRTPQQFRTRSTTKNQDR